MSDRRASFTHEAIVAEFGPIALKLGLPPHGWAMPFQDSPSGWVRYCAPCAVWHVATTPDLAEVYSREVAMEVLLNVEASCLDEQDLDQAATEAIGTIGMERALEDIGVTWVDMVLESAGVPRVVIDDGDPEATGLAGLPQSIEYLLDSLFDRVESTLASKRRDYGTDNINQTGLPGVAVRLVDKTARLHHLASTGQDPANESVQDTILDIVGYACIAAVLAQGGKW